MSAFVSNVLESINYVLCPAQISAAEVKQFDQQAESWAVLEASTHVLDFRQVTKLDPVFYSSLERFRHSLKGVSAELITVNMTPELLEQINSAGKMEVFGCLNETHVSDDQSSELSGETLREWLVQYLINAGRLAIETMFSSTVDDNLSAKTGDDFDPSAFFKVSTIDVQDDSLRAQFRLCFDEDCLKNLSRGMTRCHEPDEKTLDGTALELLNLIYGGAKSKLNNDKSVNLPSAIPSLLKVGEVQRLKGASHRVVIPYTTGLGTFYLDICFE